MSIFVELSDFYFIPNRQKKGIELSYVKGYNKSMTVKNQSMKIYHKEEVYNHETSGFLL